MIARLASALMVLAGVAFATPASAHAVLLETSPATGAVLDTVPESLRITFNEPVNPTVLRLIDATGTATEIEDFARDGASIVIATPPVAEGTNVLSWRVVSADGHPIGGSVVFSIGTVTQAEIAAEEGDPLLRPLIWLTRVVLYLSLFIGVGGAFFAAWVVAPAQLPAGARRIVRTSIVAGLVAAPLAFAFQGADLLGEGPGALFWADAWAVAAESTYAATLIGAVVAFILALVSLPAGARSRWFALAAFIGVGVALSLSGHASRAPPQALSWLVVLLHTLGVAYWVGALTPLVFLLRDASRASLVPLQRFSASAPHALAPLIVAGALLIFIQVEAVSDLWTTDYGRVLAAKLAAVAALFVVAIVNRYSLTPLVTAMPREGGRALRRSIIVELVLVVLVFGIVAGWRFTPPPRTLDEVAPAAAAAPTPAPAPIVVPPAIARLEGNGIAADLTVTPGTAGEVVARLTQPSLDGVPIDPMEITLAFGNADLGVEPIEVDAARADSGTWATPPVTIPLPGTWTVELTVLVSDFDRRIVEGTIVIPDAANAAATQPTALADDGHGHEHTALPGINVNDAAQVYAVEGADAPSIAMAVRQADAGSFLLSFTLANFRFATPEDGTEAVPGVGHAHLFLNGQYVAEFLDTEYLLPLEPGVYDIFANLNALDHRAFMSGGRLVADRVALRVGAPVADDRVVHDVPIAIVDDPPTIRVRLGETVELRLMADEPQVVHLHGFDIETEVAPHSPVTVLFNADLAGRFVAEAHDVNESPVFFLEVLP
ncbi:MAG: copper resistance protein CopC [Bauldia sp.]